LIIYEGILLAGTAGLHNLHNLRFDSASGDIWSSRHE